MFGDVSLLCWSCRTMEVEKEHEDHRVQLFTHRHHILNGK